MSDLSLQWAHTLEERRSAAAFLARTIKGDTSYISHGEVQQALSADGVRWAPDLENCLTREFEKQDESAGLVLARRGDELVGIASVSWETDAPAPHAVLADLSVEPGARSGGIGAALVAFIENEAKRRGCGFIFLESGLRNERAHAFFERADFHVISKVFMKRL